MVAYGCAMRTDTNDPVQRMDTIVRPEGLTTTKAPFIEAARADGQLYIEQPYHLYSEENHDTWRRLFARMVPRWERYANPRFLEGLGRLALEPSRVPRLEEVNAFMAPLTGFRAKAVAGYVPATQFFECLRHREFPTTVTIRDGARLDYLPEPDIFHDIAGHVPMHTDTAFADTLARFGEVAAGAVRRVAAMPETGDRVERASRALKGLARFFWFTIEFGLMRDATGGAPRGVRAYGSGLLSSYAELAHACESDAVERLPFDLERVVNEPFAIDDLQPRLFVIESFEQLFAEVGRLEQWVSEGRLDAVDPGAPAVEAADVAAVVGAEGELVPSTPAHP
jgi:phenylalanine-4-hydroxylase